MIWKRYNTDFYGFCKAAGVPMVNLAPLSHDTDGSRVTIKDDDEARIARTCVMFALWRALACGSTSYFTAIRRSYLIAGASVTHSTIQSLSYAVRQSLRWEDGNVMIGDDLAVSFFLVECDRWDCVNDQPLYSIVKDPNGTVIVLGFDEMPSDILGVLPDIVQQTVVPLSVTA